MRASKIVIIALIIAVVVAGIVVFCEFFYTAPARKLPRLDRLIEFADGDGVLTRDALEKTTQPLRVVVYEPPAKKSRRSQDSIPPPQPPPNIERLETEMKSLHDVTPQTHAETAQTQQNGSVSEVGDETADANKKNNDNAIHSIAHDVETILLIHGAFGSSALWQHALDDAWPAEERDRYQIVIPSLYGHGDSPRSRSVQYTVKEHVDSLLDVLRRFVPCGRRLHLVGYSLGAPLSIALGARIVRTLAPWSLRSLTLVAPAYFPSTDRKTVVRELADFKKESKLPNTFYLWMRYVVPRLNFALCPLVRTAMRNRVVRSAFSDAALNNAVSADFHVLAASCEALIVRYDVDAGLSTLRGVELPILVIDGERDKIYSSDPKRESLMRAAGSAASRVVIARAPHALVLEQPREFVQCLRSFVQRVS